MGRNPYIYGLAKHVYVAESGSEGGTWSGVVDGLRKGRTIYVRKPKFGEQNANLELIEKGATPVDYNGNVIGSEVMRVSGSASDYITEIPKDEKVKGSPVKKKKKVKGGINKKWKDPTQLNLL
jgi:predicted Rossmann fold nucleotide-binding protein DprA/Smf involved in DNA uptake